MRKVEILLIITLLPQYFYFATDFNFGFISLGVLAIYKMSKEDVGLSYKVAFRSVFNLYKTSKLYSMKKHGIELIYTIIFIVFGINDFSKVFNSNLNDYLYNIDLTNFYLELLIILLIYSIMTCIFYRFFFYNLLTDLGTKNYDD